MKLPLRRLATAALVGGLSVLSSPAAPAATSWSARTRTSTTRQQRGHPREGHRRRRAKLGETTGVELSLGADDEPDDGDFLASAEGALIADPPAFDGEVPGRVQGIEASDISVTRSTATSTSTCRSSAGRPSTAGLLRPDPGPLLDPDTGVSADPHRHRGPRRGESELGREDNRRDAAAVTGTVPAARSTTSCPAPRATSLSTTPLGSTPTSASPPPASRGGCLLGMDANPHLHHKRGEQRRGAAAGPE